jgi:PD-(D/E)XK nuclease superfamily protein
MLPALRHLRRWKMVSPNPETRLISGSEVKAFQSCQKKWWYEYRLKVIPRKLSDGLFKGIVGHDALSSYYRAIMEGKSLDEARMMMNLRISQEYAKNTLLMTQGLVHPKMMADRVKLIAKISQILDAYLEEYAKADYENYDVVEVEHMHVSDNFMAMRLDLLLRLRANGKLVLMDHKFVGDFYGEAQLIANSQLPLYMRTVIGGREEIISHGILNEIKTRKSTGVDGEPEFDFERAIIEYDEDVAASLASDQAKVTERIRDKYRIQGLKESRDACERSLSDYTCKFCHAKTACLVYDLRGNEAGMRAVIDAEYEENTYGYNK